jgi:hypothetical protein
LGSLEQFKVEVKFLEFCGRWQTKATRFKAVQGIFYIKSTWLSSFAQTATKIIVFRLNVSGS